MQLDGIMSSHKHTGNSALMNIHAAVLSFVLTLARSVFLSVRLTALSGWIDTRPANLLLSPPSLFLFPFFLLYRAAITSSFLPCLLFRFLSHPFISPILVPKSSLPFLLLHLLSLFLNTVFHIQFVLIHLKLFGILFWKYILWHLCTSLAKDKKKDVFENINPPLVCSDPKSSPTLKWNTLRL